MAPQLNKISNHCVVASDMYCTTAVLFASPFVRVYIYIELRFQYLIYGFVVSHYSSSRQFLGLPSTIVSWSAAYRGAEAQRLPRDSKAHALLSLYFERVRELL